MFLLGFEFLFSSINSLIFFLPYNSTGYLRSRFAFKILAPKTYFLFLVVIIASIHNTSLSILDMF